VVEFQTVISGLDGTTSTLVTEIGILQSRELIGRLVDRLDLANDPEFNARLRARESTQGPGLVGQLREAVLGPPEPEPGPRALRDAVITEVLKGISVSNASDSRIFAITAETWNAEKSARIADTLAELYVADQIGLKFQATERATLWLTERVEDLRSELQIAENALNEHNVQTELVSVEQLEALNRQLKDFRARAADLEREVTVAGERLSLLEVSGASGDPMVMAEASGDTMLGSLATQLAPGRRSRGHATTRPGGGIGTCALRVLSRAP